MTRFLLSCTAAAVLFAAPFAANAQVKNELKPEGKSGAKPMMSAPVVKKPMTHKAHATKKPMHAKHAVMHKDAGDSAVDQLNQQSLMKAQGK